MKCARGGNKVARVQVGAKESDGGCRCVSGFTFAGSVERGAEEVCDSTVKREERRCMDRYTFEPVSSLRRL